MVLALLPTVLIASAVGSGPGISPDSTSYLSAARSLLATGRLVDWSGEPLTLFPPGYPILLAAVHGLGPTFEVAGVLINCVAASGTVLVAYAIARTALGSPRAGLAIALLVAVSPVFPRNGSWLWSDPIFTLVAMAAVALMVWLADDPRRLPRVVVPLAILVSTATGIRYLGLCLVPVVAAAVFAAARTVTAPRRSIVWALTASLASSLGGIVVVARNLALGSGPLGPRYPGGRSPAALWQQSIETLGRLAAPWSEQAPPAWIGWSVLLLTVAGAAMAVRERSRSTLTVVGALAAFWALLWWSELTSPIDPVNIRLTMPAVVPLIVTAGFGVHAALRRGWLGRKDIGYLSLPRLVLGVVVLALATGQLTAGFSFASKVGAVGQGFNSVGQRDSAVADAVTPSMCEAGLAAANPWLIYWASDCRQLQGIPLQSQKTTHSDDIDSLRRAIEDGRVRYLVFLKGTASIPPEGLAGKADRFRLAGRFRDGAIYEAVG